MTIDAKRILASDNLPSPSWVALRLLRLVRSAEPDLREIVRTIKSDPALAGKILKTVNSSAFGLNKSVSSVEQAIAYIGYLTLCSLVLTFSLIPSERRSGPLAERLQLFWRSALTQAVAAEELAKRVGSAMPGEFFTAGLLQDIGVLALLRTCPDEYLPVLEQAERDGGSLSDLEHARLGLDHQLIGSELTRRWGLGGHVPLAIARHHSAPEPRSSAGPEGDLFIVTLAAAAATADSLCRSPRQPSLQRLHELGDDRFKLVGDELDAFLRTVNERVRTTAEMFSFDLGEMPSFEEMMAEAQSELIDIAMRAQRQSEQAVARASALESQHEEMERAAARLRQQARQDPLTGLPNRNALQDEIERAWQQARDDGGMVGVIFVDVDHFKRLNDTYGHLTGDQALKAVAGVLREGVASAGTAGRFGGEEFVVLLPRTTSTQIQVLAEQLRARLDAFRMADGARTIRMTASFGAAVVRPAQTVADGFLELIAAADGAMYAAKQGGRNQVRFAALGEEPPAISEAEAQPARRDPLTGLPNRALFQTILEKEWHRSADAHQPLAVLFLDLDHFHDLNRAHGQLVGDQILKAVAAAVSDVVGGDGTVARYGGEEFVAVLPGFAEAKVLEVTEQLRERIASSAISHDQASVEFTVSIGVALSEPLLGGPNGFLELLSAADHAMSLAKLAGRNQIRVLPFAAASVARRA